MRGLGRDCGCAGVVGGGRDRPLRLGRPVTGTGHATWSCHCGLGFKVGNWAGR